MKKVLLISDGERFPEQAFDYASRLNDSDPILLTGLFLPPMNYILSLTELGSIAAGLPLEDNYVDVTSVKETIATFKNACSSCCIEYRVHSERTSAGSLSDDIRMESRFADLIVMDNGLVGNHVVSDIQEEELSMVLRHAECPVVIAAGSLQAPERVVIAYDGSASCMYAIKEFIHCFPQCAALDTEIVFVHSDSDEPYPGIEYLKEFATRHFAGITFNDLDIDPELYFDTWLADQKNIVLVTGSGGRSLLSRFLWPSFIDQVIKDRLVTIFTAHR